MLTSSCARRAWAGESACASSSSTTCAAQRRCSSAARSSGSSLSLARAESDELRVQIPRSLRAASSCSAARATRATNCQYSGPMRRARGTLCASPAVDGEHCESQWARSSAGVTSARWQVSSSLANRATTGSGSTWRDHGSRSSAMSRSRRFWRSWNVFATVRTTFIPASLPYLLIAELASCDSVVACSSPARCTGASASNERSKKRDCADEDPR
mmetsp:Transcript_24744/g.79672  ORF Transcript_24744/g.79672 Transcript_24744/m.79672 type:complete len:215 (-) Transcript_24744:172-816(-)